MSQEAVETDLLAAIAAEPDAIEPRLIYADWLQGQDDPRGELLAVQAALVARPDDVELRQREKHLATEQTNRLILQAGPGALTTDLIKRWHLGFVDAISLSVRAIRMLRTSHREWFRQPAFAVVREIDIVSKFARNLRFIRHLGLGHTVRHLSFGDDYTSLEEPTIAAIAARLPNLTALHLRSNEVPPLGPLKALALRELVLDVRTLDDPGLARIMSVGWNLDTFGIKTTHNVDDDVYPILAQLYDGTTLAKVKHFVVSGAVRLINILDTLGTSKRAATLESFTGEFQRATQDELVRAERHREIFAKVKFLPKLGINDYYDVENYNSTASFLNYRLDRAADALPLYEQALRIKPEHSTARHNLAVALRKLRRLDESLVAFDMLIGQSKNPSASMFNGRHYTLCELGRRADARADLERAVTIDPQYADAWNNLGVERQYMGDSQGALEAFRRSLQLNPDHNYAGRNEGDQLLELGRADEALPIYHLLYGRKPTDRSLPVMLAHAHIETGNPTGARTLLDARFADPGQERHPRLFVLRALALRDLDQHAAANDDLEACATSTDCPAWYAMTLFIRSLGNRAAWTRVVPDAATTPREIADAVIAYGKSARASTATEMHDASIDDQMDCSELAIAAALLADRHDLAVRRARAVATLYVEQGPTYLRKWWQALATVIVIANRNLDADARALLSLVIRAVRGRARIADVMALDN